MKEKRELLYLLAVAVVILMTRLPFLEAGYGRDPDAYRLANSGRRIAVTQKYAVSRSPGYPIPEFAYSLLWRGGPVALNGTTAVLSMLAILFFALILKQWGCKDHLLAGLALALTPVVFINSTSSIDYMWALAFIMGSFYFGVLRKPVAAGVFFGLAIGCRLTSLAIVIPVLLLWVSKGDKKIPLRPVSWFIITGLVVGAAAYLPVFLEYGWGFFEVYDPGYPHWLLVIKRATMGVWGTVGTLAILLAGIAMLFISKTPERSIPKSPGDRPLIAALLTIGIFGLLFLRLPHEPGYLIPVVPFTLVVLARLLPRQIFISLCLALMISPWISVGRDMGISVGPILRDHRLRLKKEAYISRVVAAAGRLESKSVVVSGWHLPGIESHLPPHAPGPVKFVYLLTADTLEQYIGQGYKIYYLPGMDKSNFRLYGILLPQYGAETLPLTPPRKSWRRL